MCKEIRFQPDIHRIVTHKEFAFPNKIIQWTNWIWTKKCRKLDKLFHCGVFNATNVRISMGEIVFNLYGSKHKICIKLNVNRMEEICFRDILNEIKQKMFFYSMNFNFHRSYSNFEMLSHHRFDSEIFLVSVVGWCVMNWCCCVMQCIFLNEWKTNILRFSTIWFYFSAMLFDLLGNVRSFSCQGNEFFSWFRRFAWKVLYVPVLTGWFWATSSVALTSFGLHLAVNQPFITDTQQTIFLQWYCEKWTFTCVIWMTWR